MTSTISIEPYRLLEHPFYRRWEAGELRDGELAAYAAQYRFFEAQLPGFLAALGAQLDGEAAELVQANLADELGDGLSHLELFDRFAASVEAPFEVEISPAMAALVGCYVEAAASGDTARALGVLAGYEVQAAEVAQTKGAGLAEHYGVDETDRAFWALHAGLEEEHAAWTLSALEGLDEASAGRGAMSSAAAWWSFLDEREALAVA
jgi:pyrroloquinoline-quinone synthase